MIQILLSVIVIFAFNPVYSLNSLQITSWTLSNSNGSIILKNVTSPIDVYSALYLHAIIDWPLKGYNDVNYRWIAYDNWTFTSTSFNIPQSSQTILSVYGLDIHPVIMLNNHLINTKTSEFCSSDIDIDSNWLKRSNNILQFQFTSPPLLAKQISARYNNTIIPDCWPHLFRGECHINMLRKTQSSFGWDWGPAIPSMGLRGKVEFRMTNKTSVFIKGVRLVTNSDKECRAWNVSVFIKLRILQAYKSSKICVHMKIENLESERVQCIQTNDASIYFSNFTFAVDSSHLKLWWPREMGTPVLYKLKVNVYHDDRVLDQFIDYVGFRRVDLNQSTIPGYNGRYFMFNINCKPFFVKGANWVPRSYLTYEWSNQSYLEFLLNLVVDANMNTIRLWGGGKPELKLFYSIADRLGVMIWHELMFAGSLYPDSKEFYEEIRHEITDIVWTTQIHPCTLLWSGNNEIELLIADGWYNSKPMDPRHIISYDKTFNQFIKPLVTSLDPYVPFILSSPTNGVESERNHGVSKNPQSPYFGDVHFYEYYGDLWNEDSYPITRMTTEFGFPSYPNTDTWAQIITSDKDFAPNGSLVNHRQHLVNGYVIIESAILKYFGHLKPSLPSSARDSYKWFSYLSQLNQAIILKVHINRLRSSQCTFTQLGEGYTSGAIFWQLNDNWIAPSWSTIDSTGQLKLAHYYVKNAFSKERIIVAVLNATFTVRLIVQDIPSVTQYNLILTCIDSSKNVSVAVTGIRKTLINSKTLSCNVATILSLPVVEFLRDCKCKDKSHCVVEASLLKDGKVVSTDSTLFVEPKNMHLPIEVSNDIIKFRVTKDNKDAATCVITMRSKFVHLFVYLTTNSSGTFSDNGFHLWKTECNVTFSPWSYNTSEVLDCLSMTLNIISLNGLEMK